MTNNEDSQTERTELTTIIRILIIFLGLMLVILAIYQIQNIINLNTWIAKTNQPTKELLDYSNIQSNKEISAFVVLAIFISIVLIYSLHRLTKRFETDTKLKEARRLVILAIKDDKITQWNNPQEKEDTTAILTQLIFESEDVTLSNAREIYREIKRDKTDDNNSINRKNQNNANVKADT